MLNYYFGSFVPLRKPVAYAVESAFQSPFQWTQHRKLYKGGNFFEDIGNSVSGFFSDPISYTGDRLAEIDKTVIQPVYREVIQPVGKVLEGVGKAIANDPITFVATVAAVATGNAWMVPIIQGVSTAAKGGDVTDIVKSVAISAATTWVGGQVGEFVSSGMEAGTAVVNGKEVMQYSLMGQAIEKSTATVIGNVVGYSSAGAIGAAAMGKNGDQILTAALANGAGAALPLVLGNIPGFNDLAAGTVKGIAPDVSKAIANGISGVAGSVVAAAIQNKDVGAAAAAGIITAGINGLVSTKNMVTDLFKDAGAAVGISNLSTQTQAIIANTMSSVFATALNGGKAGNILQQSMLAIGTQALQGYITDGIKNGSNIVNQLFDQTEKVENIYEAEFERYQDTIDDRNDVADKINVIADRQVDLADQYEAADNALDAYMIKSQGYQQQYDSTYAAYQSYVNKANALVNTVNTKGNAANALAGKVNAAAQQVNDLVANQKWHLDQYNQRIAQIDPLVNTYNWAVQQEAQVATNRVYAGEGGRAYLPPGTQVAYGANGQYAYATVGSEGYIDFTNDRFGDPIYGTYKYGYAITFGGYTSAELEGIRTDITNRTNDANNYANVANQLATQANTAKANYDALNGQYQTALTEYNAAKTEHDNWEGKATSTLTTVNQIASQLNTVNTNINNTVNTMNGINTEITNLNKEYTTLDGQLKNYDVQIPTIEKTLTDLKTQHADLTVKLNDAATPLTQEINNLTSKITNDLVAALDPSFNAEEYKQINNLGSGIDAATHWLSIGKDAGLYTNNAAADAAKTQAAYNLVSQIAKARGYEGAFELSKSDFQKIYQDVTDHYGNDVFAMEAATPETFAYETKIPTANRVAAFDPNKLAQNVSDKATYGAWNAPEGIKVPTGTKLATAEEYANGKATAIQTKDGNIAYVVSDGTQTTKAMGTDGNLVDVPVGATAEKGPDGSWTISIGQGEDATHITVRGAAGQEEAPGALETVDPMEQDPLAALYTFNTMDAGLLGDWSKPGDRIIEGSKAIIAWAEEKAKTGESSNILAIASNVVGGFGEQFQSFAGLAALVGTQPENTDLYKLGQQLIDLQKSSTPADFAKRYAEFEAQYQNVTGLQKGWAFIKGAVNYPSEFMMGMVLPEIAQEVIPTLLGAGVGKIAASGAGALASVAPKIAAWASKWAGVTTAAASDVAESFGANYNDTYAEAKTLAAKAHPEWSKQQIEEYATNQGLTVGLVGALTTGISMGVGGAELAKSLLGPKASAEAVEGLTGWLGNIAGKLTSTGKIMVKEGLSEAVVEEMPTQLVKDLLFLDIDPNRDIAGNVSLAGAQAFTTAGMTTGSISAAHQTALGIAEVALQSNDAFMNAINGTKGNATQLGNVLNQWLPMTTAQGADLRNTIVPAIFEQHPDWGLQYATAEDYARTVATLGVKDPTALTELVDKRFDTAVTTGDELATELYNKGLTDVTIGDIKNVLGTGTQTPTQVSAAAADYVNKNMVSQAEVQAAATQEGYKYTQAEMDALVGRGVQADVIQKFIQEIDPKAVTTAEATQYFKDLGYTKATAADIATFVKSAPEAEVQAAVAAWVDPRQVTRKEAIDFFAQLGYVPTEAEINQYVVQGPEVVQDTIKKNLETYVDPRYVDAEEVRAAFKALGLDAPVSAGDIARYSGQYAESELAGKAKEALPVVSSNAVYALLAGNSIASQQVKDEILARIDQYKNLGMDQAAAQAAATQAVAAQLGTTKSDLLGALGATEQNLLTQITGVKGELLTRIEQYRSEGKTQAEANAKAVADVSAKLGITKTELLAQLGATESNLQTQISGVSAKVDTTAKAIMDQMAANQAAGQSADTALNNAINKVASDLGSTKDNLLAKMGLNQAELQKQIAAVQAGTQAQINTVQQQILDKVAQYQAQGISSDKALQAAIDTVASSLGTTKTDLLSQIGQTEAGLKTYVTQQVSATESRLADLIAKNEAAGMARSEATQAAIDELSGQLGTTRTDLLNKIDLTSQQFTNQIEIAKTDLGKQITLYQQQTGQQLADTKAEIQAQMVAYEKAGVDRDTALSLAISGVAQDLGTTKADLLTKIGSSETALRNEFTQQTTALSTQVKDVAALLGKPVSQVTANDITMVKNMIAGQTQTNLAYDINQDGKIDINDQTALETQLAIQNNPNIKQQVDPNTGLTILVDTTTGKQVDTWEPAAGTPWAASGIYDVLKKQQDEAAQVAKTATEKAKVTQQKSQFGQLMGMLFSAPDVMGQTTTVKTPDPAKINYIYDFSSIFANPSQASLMPSPYGAVNTVMPMQPQQKQQAANQPLFQLASGFAEGGIVGGNDIQVGGGSSIDDLLNILKGNG